MTENATGRSLDLSRHVVPAGVVVSAIIGALIGWWQLEERIEKRIEDKLVPVRANIVRIERNQSQDMREIKTTLKVMRRDLSQMRESLARMEGGQ